MMNPEQAVFAAIACCAAGAALTLIVARWRWLAGWMAFAFTAGSAALITAAATEVLAGSAAAPGNRWLAARAACQHLQVDGLATLFLLLAAAVASLASLYSIRYLRLYPGNVARYYPFFLLFVASLYGLFSTTETTWFFTYWQLLVLSGYMLIRFDRAATPRGANRFLLLLEIAGAAIVAGMALPGATMPAILMLLGFGITMGLWPFGQMWLPHASPVAPAPVSVLFSGVLIKVGVYGVIRHFLFVLPAVAGNAYTPDNWGMLLAVLGTITLFTGTMRALQQEQSKRLLAFHSIGQTGYMLLAVGTCLALADKPGTAAASIAGFALLAALFHIVNHTLFSASLYFNAGSVMEATGTQDLNQLGGLMKYMPLTGLTALVGSLSISGVPLFNGFASKWAIFAAAIQGAASARYLAVCAVIAILTSGLTLASFIKWFGATFLSRTSGLVRQKAALSAPAETGALASAASLEVGWSMQLPQVLLSLMCVLLGVAPGLAFAFLRHALAASPQGLGPVLAHAAQPAATSLGSASAPQAAALFWPLPLLALFAATFLVAYGISRLGSASRRTAEPWLCGYVREAQCGPYVAHNFYGEIKRRFRWLGGLQNGRAAVVKGRAS